MAARYNREMRIVLVLVLTATITFGQTDTLGNIGAGKQSPNHASSDPRLAKALAARVPRAELLTTWRELALIPAPSDHEDARADYILKRLRAAGYADAFKDEAGNVVSARIPEGQNAVVFESHMDTVMQPGVPVTITEEGAGKQWTGPAVGDDATGVAVCLTVAEMLAGVNHKPQRPIIWLFSTNEEGGGKREGVSRFIKDNPGRVLMFISVDGSPIDRLGAVADYGTGYYGFQAIFTGPGMHTIESFGVPSTTHAMSLAIAALYKLDVPQAPVERRSWLNIGKLEAGTVPNAMARESRLWLDLRSNDAQTGRTLQKQAMDAVNTALKQANTAAPAAKPEDAVTVRFEQVRERDPIRLQTAEQKELTRVLRQAYESLDVKPELGNIGSSSYIRALREGIAAAGVGVTNITGMHSPKEVVEVEPLFTGLAHILRSAVLLGQ